MHRQRASSQRLPCRSSATLSVVLLFSGVVACTPATDRHATPAIRWTEHHLPEPEGPPGRNVVRDAIRCGDIWYVLGAVFLALPTLTRDTRPALWASPNGSDWNAVPVKAGTYWGRRAILNSAACSQGRIVAVGARSGGAHGNPRVTTFYLNDADELVDVRAIFTQFGGVSATNVGPISGGPDGWLIVGNRLSGPSAWTSDDPRGFTLVEGEPGLTADGDVESLAQGASWDGDEWVMVGAGAKSGSSLNRDPLAWSSPDGLRWTPEKMPSGARSEDVHRVTVLPTGEMVAVGLTGDRFAAWTRVAGSWALPRQFGHVVEDWTGAPYVASLVTGPAGVLATVSNGAVYELWHSSDGAQWRALDVPVVPTVAGDHTLAAASGDGLLLVADDGSGGRVWTGALK